MAAHIRENQAREAEEEDIEQMVAALKSLSEEDAKQLFNYESEQA